ncbi:hypothetical protein M9Y10_024774 [Tritrichomonas musculus]|uniref:DUF3447 domain-containing protein n=1 Tax=Tritrichomonas musculus TaxID=1915356 RepID=A0ABR2HC21_9EUKA
MNFSGFNFSKTPASTSTSTPLFSFSMPITASQLNNDSNIRKTTNNDFIIIVKDHKYACNKYAVNSSEVIREFRQNNPNVKEYKYNYEGPADDFEIICSYLNFKPINISKKNLESLRIISENLKINSLLTKINDFIRLYEEKTQKLNPIKEVFNWLYHIKELTVESVKNSVVNSIFSHHEGNVVELSSFIMQVVRSSFTLQPFLVDLIIALDESSDETNDLSFLKPFISKRILDIFYTSKFYCCFAYQLSKKGVIPIQDIIKKIISIDEYVRKGNSTVSSNNIGWGSGSGNNRGLGRIYNCRSATNNSYGWGSSNVDGWGSSTSSGWGSSTSSGWGSYTSSDWGYPTSTGFNFSTSNTSGSAGQKSASTSININGVDIHDELIKLLLKFDLTNHQNIVSWFLPELIKNKLIATDDLQKDYISYFVNGRMDAYRKMRDTLEPDNQISKAILDDDVESLQSIISQNNVDVNSCLPRDIFNVFDVENEKSMLNYSAENGSIKCFKFLMLNHAIADQFTLGYAVYGGRTELIGIIEEQIKSTNNKANPYINLNRPPQQKEHKSPTFSFNFGTTTKLPNKTEFAGHFQFNKDSLVSPIEFTIMNHQYDLFDWIVDAKINSKELTNECLSHLLEISLICGNVHSFAFCVNEGLKLSNCLVEYLDMIKITSIFGFCKFVELIPSIFNHKTKQYTDTVMNESCVIAGNISIFKLFAKKFKIDYSNLLSFAIQKDYGAIVKYILDDLYHPQKKEEILSIFKLAIEKDLSSVFKIIVEKYPLDYLDDINEITSLCQTSCSNRNYDISKTLIDFLIRKYIRIDLTSLFFKSFISKSEEICNYLLQHKKFINFDELINNYQKIFVSNTNLALKLLDKFDPNIKKSLERLLFDTSMSNNNKYVFKLYLHKNLDKRNILIGAVNFNDINLVNQILTHNTQPSFINQISQAGTALSIAINNNNLAIFNRLLQLPGIDPNLEDSDGYTSFMLAIINLNIEMVGNLVDFYGDQIQLQFWQLPKAILGLKSKYLGINKQVTSEVESKILFIIKGLLQINANLSFKGLEFLSAAIRSNCYEIVKFLIEIENVDVNERESFSGNTPLITASSIKNEKIAQLLVDNAKTDINASNNKSINTALTYAASNNMISLVSALVTHPNFDPYSSNINLAFYSSSADTITSLLYPIKGLDVNYQVTHDGYKITDFNYSSWYSTNSFYFSSGFNIRHRNSSNSPIETSLTKAVLNNKYQKVEMIIKHPTFDKLKSNIKEALFISIHLNDSNIFNLLFQSINDYKIVFPNGKNLLEYLFDVNQLNIWQCLLSISNLEISKDDLLMLYRKSSRNDLLLSLLVEYDEKHDHFIDLNEPITSITFNS